MNHSKTPEPNNTNSQEEHNQFLKHLQRASNKVKTWPIWKQHLLGQIPGEEITINDEIWWILHSGTTYYQYYDHTVAETERDSGTKSNYDRTFSTDEWVSLGGEKLTNNSIIPIRPLHIEKIETPKDMA